MKISIKLGSGKEFRAIWWKRLAEVVKMFTVHVCIWFGSIETFCILGHMKAWYSSKSCQFFLYDLLASKFFV